MITVTRLLVSMLIIIFITLSVSQLVLAQESKTKSEMESKTPTQKSYDENELNLRSDPIVTELLPLELMPAEDQQPQVSVQPMQGIRFPCLIATATYGSELAPQVQMLREIRDNVVLSTKSGTSFMTVFNAFYYSFSPTIANWEKQNPTFKEIVKVTITPLISSLSVLQYIDIDSETEMLGYGIGVILLNIGMYFIVPTFLIIKVRRLFK